MENAGSGNLRAMLEGADRTSIAIILTQGINITALLFNYKYSMFHAK